MADTEGEREQWRRANRVGMWLIIAPVFIVVFGLLVVVGVQVALGAH